MKLELSQQQLTTVALSLTKKFDKILSNRGKFALPHSLEGQVSGTENILQNKAFGKVAARYMRSQIKQLIGEEPDAKGSTILYYGFAFGDDCHWIPYAMQNNLYVEIRDVSNIAVHNAIQYSEKITLERGPGYEPEVFLDDISNIEKIDTEHVRILYACRVIGLVNKPYQLLQHIGESLFRREVPGRLVAIQSFDDSNESDKSFMMTLLNKQKFLSSLEQGAGRKLSVVNEKTIDYYHKKVTAITIK